MIKISGIDKFEDLIEQKHCVEFCVAFFMRDTEKLTEYLDDDIVVELVGKGKLEGRREFDESYSKALDIRAVEIAFDHVLSHGVYVSADGKWLTDDGRWLGFMFVGELVGYSEVAKFNYMKLCIAPIEG